MWSSFQRLCDLIRDNLRVSHLKFMIRSFVYLYTKERKKNGQFHLATLSPNMVVIRLSMMMNQFLHCCPSLDGIIGVDFRCGGCGVYGVGDDDDESLFVRQMTNATHGR